MQQESLQQQSATEVMLQRQVSDLRNENQSLKQVNEKLQQENRTSTARIAELETQLAELRSKPMTPVSTPLPVRRVANAGSAYEQGLTLFRTRNYDDALATFQSILEGDAGEYEDLSIYWSGECNFALRNYQAAIENFQQIAKYGKSTKKDDAQFMLGQVYFAMGDKARAREEYEKLIDKFPASEYVKRAKARLNQM
jgi:TolA-binding protein